MPLIVDAYFTLRVDILEYVYIFLQLLEIKNFACTDSELATNKIEEGTHRERDACVR